MQDNFRDSNQIVQWTNNTNYLFQQHNKAGVSISQRFISTKFRGSKSAFMKYVVVIS